MNEADRSTPPTLTHSPTPHASYNCSSELPGEEIAGSRRDALNVGGCVTVELPLAEELIMSSDHPNNSTLKEAQFLKKGTFPKNCCGRCSLSGLLWFFLEFGPRTELRRGEALSQEVCFSLTGSVNSEHFRVGLPLGRRVSGFFLLFQAWNRLLLLESFVPVGGVMHEHTGCCFGVLFFSNVCM